MPERRSPKRPDYDDDFYAWSQHQAAVLREMPVVDNRFDRENVAEEIEDLGRSYRDAVRSQVRRIIEHFLKLQYSPAQDPRADWMASIVDARATLDDKLSATLRADVAGELPKLYRVGRKQASLGLEGHGEHEAAERMPSQCPYSLEDIFHDDWYPEPVVTP